MRTECADCGNNYQMIAGHWVQTSCNPPKISDYQWEVLTGVLMGDGNVRRVEGGASPHFRCGNTNKEYLEYLDLIFPVLGNGVKHRYTGEEMKALPSSTGDNYKDVYSWATKSVPELSKLYKWYDSGKKVFPEGLSLTPTVLKNWYVCDGHFCKSEEYVYIGAHNEKDNTDKLESYFKDAGLPIPRTKNGRIRWLKDQSVEVIDYMGDPIPGFGYKWPS